MEFLTKIEWLLGGNYVNALVYAAILFVFIIGLIKCVLPVLRNRGLLRRAVRNIRAGAGAKHSWQEDDFLGKGVLNAHWSEYLNNLFFADGVYHNASNVEDYINEETVIYGPGRGSFADAVPSLLVSIGFLGTLLGLASGLSGFSMNDSQAVMDSIVTLIPGMRYAFMTSIFGVIGSVAFTMATRAVHGSTQHALRDFYGAMSRHAGVLSVDPMTQVAIYQQEQTALIRRMSEDLAGNISENIAEAVGKAVEPLNQSLRNFVAVNTREQMRFLDAVVSRFIDRMEEMLGGEVQRLSDVLRETVRRQEEAMQSVHDCLHDTTDMLGEVRAVAHLCEDMVRANAAYIDSLRAAQRQTDEAFGKVSGCAEQLELIARQQNNYLASVNSMQAEVTRSIEKMNASVAGFTERCGELNAANSASLLKAAAELRATGAQMEQIHKGCAASITEELRITLDAYQDYVNQFTQRVDYLAGGIVDSLNRLPAAVDDSANALLDQVDRLSDVMVKAQRALNDTAGRLYGDRR